LFGFKIKQLRELHLHAGDVVVENFIGQQLALRGLAAGIANGTGRTAGHGNRMVAEELKPPQRQQRHQITDVQAVRRRVKAAVERDGLF